MAFLDKIKAKATDLGLDEKAALAKEKAAAAADKNRDKIAGAVDKAAKAADKKTNGQYSSQISIAKQAAVKGVDKIAEQQPGQQGSAPVVAEDAVERKN